MRIVSCICIGFDLCGEGYNIIYFLINVCLTLNGMSKFKVGDRVRVRDVEVGTKVGRVEFICDMRCLCGLEGTIVQVRAVDGMVDGIDFDNPSIDGGWHFVDEWLEAVDNKVDLAALLSRCIGVCLWCPIYGYGKVVNLTVESSNGSALITVSFSHSGETFEHCFTADGRFVYSLSSAECMLYPSAQLLTWGPCLKRVRVPRGDHYFYIESDFRVESTDDLNTIADSERFIIGNYFSTESDAEAALGKILSCLNAR